MTKYKNQDSHVSRYLIAWKGNAKMEQAVMEPAKHGLWRDGHLQTKLLLIVISVVLVLNLMKKESSVAYAQLKSDSIGSSYNAPQLSAYQGGVFVLQNRRLTLYEYGPDPDAKKGERLMRLHRVDALNVSP